MTVISAMKFNETDGAIISDEQSSIQNYRKYDIAEKLHEFSNEKMTFVIGGTGTANILYEISNNFAKLFNNYSANESRKNIKENGINYLVNNLSLIMMNEKRNRFDSYLQFNLGISEKDFKRGYSLEEDGTHNPLSERLMMHYFELLGGKGVEHIFNNAFLSIGKDSDGLNIYHLGMREKPSCISRPYASDGSGSDAADSELISFFDSKNREDKKNINRVEGLVALISSTESASKKNVGVGGLPHIKILMDDKIITPSEENSKLATEIVKAVQEGHASEDFQNEAIHELLFKDGDFKKIESKFIKQSNNPIAMIRMLRGYHEADRQA